LTSVTLEVSNNRIDLLSEDLLPGDNLFDLDIEFCYVDDFSGVLGFDVAGDRE
jgi:hypothetical protein